MPVVNPSKLVALQQASDNVRNICILAHVDHGKTSLSDALLATNGIISPKLAGKIRYLDSRPDEQLRGITMESSAISLLFSIMRRASPDAEPKPQDYLINLIDSPGHIDFSSEVSTASRLCDGAVVLVDAVEGVCSQTVTVLRQSWIEKLKPLLVINKMDRLITELQMSAAEAYTHLSQLLEQVNAVMGSFVLGEMQEDDLRWRERMEERVKENKSKLESRQDTDGVPSDADSVVTDSVYEEKDDEDIYFAPEKNNVIFSSAIDGWAFTVKQFSGLYEKKLGIKRALLEKVLWGDFYLDPKTKRILSSKHLKGRNLKPMFVQLVLENIWAVYEATTGGPSGKGDPAMVEKITKSLSLTIPNHVLRSRDPRTLLTTLFASWLPLPTAILVSVIEHLPSPNIAQAERMAEIVDSSPGGDHVDKSIKNAMVGFKKAKDQPIVAYVSKMVSVKDSELPQNKRQVGGTMTAEEARELARKKRAEFAKAQAASDTDGLSNALAGTTINDDQPAEPEQQEVSDPEHLIGFARLFSGTLDVGDEVWVIPPKFNPAHPQSSGVQAPRKVTITALYLLMGRSLEALQSVPAGVVFGIGGLEGAILKSGTLCSSPEGAVNLAGVNMGAIPIVRVALEPVMPSDLDKMISGLKLLVQSDPCAEYEVLENGEHVILTAGELHLERCLKDLRERFAKCEIQAGEPIVPYRESLVNVPAAVEVDLEHAPRTRDQQLPRGTVIGLTSSKQVTIKLRVRPLPAPVTDFLAVNASTVRRLYSERTNMEHSTAEADLLPVDEEADTDILDSGRQMTLEEFKEGMRKAFTEAKADRDVWGDCIEKIAAFGPRRCGPNLLVDNCGTCQRVLEDQSKDDEDKTGDHTLTAKDLSDKISYAFQLATAQGPLCHEPMQGVAVFLEDVTLTLPSEENHSARDQAGRLTGEVIRTARDSIRLGFLEWSTRIMLAMYSCEIQASTEVLGRVYGVITRRRGRILSEAMKEGTPFFSIQALLPIVESFGFSEEMRKRTGGFAQPQLVFSGFEALGEDPFWVPVSEEELEDLGELADKENVAKRYVDGVRRRKGLKIRGKRLVDAEKQKTLKR